MQPEHGAKQYRFAGSRAANNTEYLVLEDSQVEVIVNSLITKLIYQIAHFDQWNAHQPISVKNIEKTASTTITVNTDSTTALVVLRPTAPAERPT